VSPAAISDGWNVFDADGRLVAELETREAAEIFARQLGWSPPRRRRQPWYQRLEPYDDVPSPIRLALEAWRKAEADADARGAAGDDNGEDPRAAVRRARKRWEEAVLADRRKLF
jgi:hypothetical protein